MSPTITESPLRSGIQQLLKLPQERRAGLIDGMDAQEKMVACLCWDLWARSDQIEPPGDWRIWLLRSGRGAGKTRTGAETIRRWVETGRYGRIAFVGATAADVRDIMVEGESGILATGAPWCRPQYQAGRRRVVWPNGAQATMFSAEEPDRLRGPQHDAAWCDEAASWHYPESFYMLEFGLRLGTDPRAIVTTTPRPTKLIKELIKKPTTVQTLASTYANRANLAPAFFDEIIAAYEGTRLGRQEIYGDVLEDVEGALWTHVMLEDLRVSEAPALKRIVVAIDPAVTSGENSDETGIIVAGADERSPSHGYVLEDLSGRYRPEEWAKTAVEAYHRHKADRIIGEANNGGDLIESVIRTIDPTVAYSKVHAARGKFVRAEPVSTIYEKGRAHHVGMFAKLEDQMTNFTVDIDRKIMGSPDRVDALVWAFWALMVGRRGYGKPPATSRAA